MEWIVETKEKPEEEARYIVWTNEGKWVDAAWFQGTWCFALDSLNCTGCTVTHWLKISPPKEG